MLRAALLGIALVTALSAQASAQPAQYAVVPGQSLGSPGQSPVEQQVQQNYRTQLMQAQRELLQQNPSGLGRDQIEINRQLNSYNAAPAYNPPPVNNAAPLYNNTPQPPAGLPAR